MRDLIKTIPDVNALLALEPEELGAKLIFLIARRERDGRFHPNSYQIELELAVPPDAHYPPAQVPQAQLAISEAFAWLEAQALVVPEPGYNGQNGWRLLSRRARRFETELDFSSFAAAHRLPREALHPAMSEKVWLAFMRGDFDAAVFQATSAVEISVREASGLQNSVFGVDLMRRAFGVGLPTRTRSRQSGRRCNTCSPAPSGTSRTRNPIVRWRSRRLTRHWRS